MAKFLRDLLDAEEPLFSHAISQLEKASGNQGIDVRLIADIMQRSHKCMRDLSLDPSNTTGKELYQSLMVRIASDNERIVNILGLCDNSTVSEINCAIINKLKDIDFDRDVFVLKKEKAISLLRQMPPKNLIDKLGYSSLDDMMGAENFNEIYSAIRFSEGEEWLSSYNRLFKSVTPDDYEKSKIRIIELNKDKYSNIAKAYIAAKGHYVNHVKEIGVVSIMPVSKGQIKGYLLATLLFTAHYMNEIKLYSNFFKHKMRCPGFGEKIANTFLYDPADAVQMAGHNVHWRVVQRYYGKLNNDLRKSLTEPHIYLEGMYWSKAEDVLAQIDPDIKFWLGSEYVGVLLDDVIPVSMNLADVALGYANNVRYEKRHVRYFREHLWNEIYMRFMKHPNLEQQVQKCLENNMIIPSM